VLGPSHQRPWELRALRQVRIAAVLALVGTLAANVIGSIPSVAPSLSVTPASGSLTVSPSLPQVAGVLLGLTAVFGLLVIVRLRSAFRTLSEISSDFSTPSTLASLAFLGVVLLAVGSALVLGALHQAIDCAGAGNPLTSGCLFTSLFWAGLGPGLVGAVVALVGLIGILIGIWRLGNRFSDAWYKVAAILLILPLASIAGEVLLILRTGRELGRR